MYTQCRACNRCAKMIMPEGFSALTGADFYDNESDKVQHGEMSTTGSVVLRVV